MANRLLEKYVAVVRSDGIRTKKNITALAGSVVDFTAATSVALPAVAVGASTITSASANALAVGPGGTTNPILNVDASTASAVAGLNVKGAATGGTVAVSTTDSGSNTSLTVDGKGTGTVGINTTSTTSGLVTIGNSTSLAGAAVNGAVVATKQLRSSTVTALGTTGTVSLDPTLGQVFSVTPTGSITLNAASAPAGALVYVVVTTSGTSSFNITPTTNFKTTGALATGTVSGKVFTLTFVSDGTNLNEVARTTAM